MRYFTGGISNETVELSKLRMMKGAGLLSEEEFAEQKLLLLDEIQED